MRTGEVSKRVGVSTETIRQWANTYSEFLSPAATPEKGAIRDYTDDDVRVLLTIKQNADRRRPVDEIKDILKSGERVQEIPDIPDPMMDTVPALEYALVVEERDGLKGKLALLQKVQDKNQGLQEKIADLQHRIGAAEKEAEIYKELYQEEKKRKKGFFR